jgi:hypothetical protein
VVRRGFSSGGTRRQLACHGRWLAPCFRRDYDPDYRRISKGFCVVMDAADNQQQ